MINGPSPTGSNGQPDRDTKGRFLPGNRRGQGNPMARRAQKLRVAVLRAVEPTDRDSNRSQQP